MWLTIIEHGLITSRDWTFANGTQAGNLGSATSVVATFVEVAASPDVDAHVMCNATARTAHFSRASKSRAAIPVTDVAPLNPASGVFSAEVSKVADKHHETAHCSGTHKRMFLGRCGPK